MCQFKFVLFLFYHSSSYQMQLSHSDQNISLLTKSNQPASIASSLQQLFSNETNVIEVRLLL